MARGRPPFIATDQERKTVEAMSAYGIPHADIVLVIERPAGKERELRPISEPTLRKYFRKELDVGAVKTLAKVADALVQTAIDRKHKNHVAAAIFFLKARGGWSEKAFVEHGGSVGLDLDLTGATPQELEILERFLSRKAESHRAANAA